MQLSLEEKSIIAKLRDRDQIAFRKLFDSYYKLLYAYARKFVHDDIANDAVQDLFASIWQKSDSLNITTSLQNYLISGVRNNCLHWLEKQKVRNKFVNDSVVQMAIDEINFYANSGDSYQSLVEVELQGEIEKAVLKFPPQCQKVFAMSRTKGKKNKEIAEELGISVKGVEKHLTKALKILKEDLKDYLPLLIILLK